MDPTDRPRVKICCISSAAEAQVAIRHGASAVGLVSSMPSGPGVIDDERIRTIASGMPSGISSFLLTSRRTTDSIIDQMRLTGATTVQICDTLDRGTYADLALALPGVTIVQVVHVTGPDSVDEALAVAEHVDALLLDSGNPSLPVKELGGTGRTHDWSVSAEIRRRAAVPVYLAGGLHSGNVGEAIRRVGPYGLDVCSGVRTRGALDPAKLASFFHEIRLAR